jgi:hypothetical protein
MADKKSKTNPYQWPNGQWHSIPWSQEQQRQAAKPQFVGYSPEQINTLNQIIPGGTGVQGVPGVTDTPGGGFTPAQFQAALPPAPTPQPVDPALLNAQLVANRNVAISKGQAAYDTGNLGFDYGYNPDGSVNTANPYSRAALYQLGYENSTRGTTNSYAAQGQLYSGALQNAQGENQRQYAMNEAGNRLAYQRGLHGIQTGQVNTAANAGTGVSDADFQALLRATYPGS